MNLRVIAIQGLHWNVGTTLPNGPNGIICLRSEMISLLRIMLEINTMYSILEVIITDLWLS